MTEQPCPDPPSTAAALQPRAATAGRTEVLIATLGTRPAVVTTTLDLLLGDGWSIHDVVVVHTSPTHADPAPHAGPDAALAVADAIQRLDAEFPGGTAYRHRVRERPCRYRRVPLCVDGRLVGDVDSPEEAEAVFTRLYAEVAAHKERGDRVHLGIAGGRKAMAVYGMAVAQLLFDQDDRLWHVVSSPAFQRSGRLHPHPGAGEAALVSIPVLPLGLVYVGPIGQLLGDGDPVRAITDQRDRLAQHRRALCADFLDDVLTAEERRLVKLFLRAVLHDHRSPTHQWLAAQLHISEHTVRKRLSEVYDKLSDHFALYDAADHRVLIGLFAPFAPTLLN